MIPNDADRPKAPTPEEQRAADAVRSLSAPAMDEDLRRKLRAEFVSGALGAAGPTVVPGTRLRGPTVVALFGLAAAACLALVVWLGSQSPHWRYAGASGETGEVWICGRVMDPNDREAIEDMLHPGTPVRTTGEMQVDLVLRNRLSVQVAPEAEMKVPEWPHKWFGGMPTCEVLQGEIRFVTGPELSGSRLMIQAPLATIEVMGTTFAVITGEDSTCVCVLDGEVRMTDPDGTVHPVTAGLRRSVFRAEPPLVEDILPMERMKLEMLRDQGAGR